MASAAGADYLRDMAFFVKVIPPMGRARVHAGDCTFCRDGRGQEHQDKGTGPTYWKPAYPLPGYSTVAEAKAFMDGLGPRYTITGNTGFCKYCMQEQARA
jgi:hypothetical protein